MAVEPAELRTFPLFPKLPFELRDQIWRESLPDKVTCSLCFYRDRCWTFERLTPSDKEYNHHIAEFVYDGQLRRKLLEEIELNLPHFFVNREARHNALTRMRAHDLKRRVARAGQSLVLARPFRLRRDALYIAPEMFGHFFFDSGDLGSEDEDKVPVLTARSAVTCIAATEESLSVGRHAGYLVSAMVSHQRIDRIDSTLHTAEALLVHKISVRLGCPSSLMYAVGRSIPHGHCMATVTK